MKLILQADLWRDFVAGRGLYVVENTISHNNKINSKSF